VLWGGRDRHFPPAQGRRLAETVPDARFVLIEDGAHWMMWHRAAEVAGHLADFLRP
jgi:pimeloyl-ACP methyl ester carboxylesterase